MQRAPILIVGGTGKTGGRVVVQLLLELFTIVLDRRNTPVMHGIEEALGRPARHFSDYVRRTVASGIWNIR